MMSKGRILFLRSQTPEGGRADTYAQAARASDLEPFSFSPISKTELPLEELVEQLEQLESFDGVIMTSVSTGPSVLTRLINWQVFGHKF